MQRLVLCGVAVDEYDAGVDDAPRPELRTGTPLHHAITTGNEEVVTVLLELGGADIERTDRVVQGGKKANSNVDALGLRPLARAALLGRDGVVRVLLEHGADHAALSNGQRRTSLCCGCATH